MKSTMKLVTCVVLTMAIVATVSLAAPLNGKRNSTQASASQPSDKLAKAEKSTPSAPVKATTPSSASANSLESKTVSESTTPAKTTPTETATTPETGKSATSSPEEKNSSSFAPSTLISNAQGLFDKPVKATVVMDPVNLTSGRRKLGDVEIRDRNFELDTDSKRDLEQRKTSKKLLGRRKVESDDDEADDDEKLQQATSDEDSDVEMGRRGGNRVKPKSNRKLNDDRDDEIEIDDDDLDKKKSRREREISKRRKNIDDDENEDSTGEKLVGRSVKQRNKLTGKRRISSNKDRRSLDNEDSDNNDDESDDLTLRSIYDSPYRKECKKWLTKWKRNFWYIDYAQENILYDACSAWYMAEQNLAKKVSTSIPESVYGRTELTKLSPNDVKCFRDLFTSLIEKPNYDNAYDKKQIVAYTEFLGCLSETALTEVRRVKRIVHSIETYLTHFMIDCFALHRMSNEQCRPIENMINKFGEYISTSKRIHDRLLKRYPSNIDSDEESDEE